MSSDHIVKSKHWLARAAEIRAIAASMGEGGVRASMLKLAKDYDKLAARAVTRSERVTHATTVAGIIPVQRRD